MRFVKVYRIAVFGMAHLHAGILLKDSKKLGEKIEIIGYTDYLPCNDFEKRINESLKYTQLPDYYENPEDLIALKPDIGIVCCDNASHKDVAVSLMENGIIPIIEKPLAFNVKDAIDIYETSQKTGVQFITNWPVAWFSPFKFAKKIFDEGVIGEPLRFIYRTTATLGPYSYDGPRKFDEYECSSWWYNSERGGGALIDYCGYGSILSTYFLNECPYEVYGHKRRFMMPDNAGDVEDYAMLTMQFKNTVGYAEGSWSTPAIGCNRTGPIIYGTEGVLVCNRYDNLVEVYTDRYSNEPSQSYVCNEEPETVLENLISHLDNGTELNPMLLPKVNMWVSAILDAGIRSCKSGVPEKILNYFK